MNPLFPPKPDQARALDFACLGTDDIYFLEVCMYATLCANGAELFSEDIQVGTVFHCQLHEAGYNQLRDWILASA